MRETVRRQTIRVSDDLPEHTGAAFRGVETSVRSLILDINAQNSVGDAHAWAVITVSGGTHSLTSGHNISAVTDGATGICTVTLDVPFTDANWDCVAKAEGSGTAVANARVATTSSKAASSVVISTYDLSATPALADSVSISMAGYGAQS